MVGVWEGLNLGPIPNFFLCFGMYPKIIDVHPKLIPKGGVVQFCRTESHREGIFVFHIVTIDLLELNTNIRCPGLQHKSCRFQVLMKKEMYSGKLKKIVVTISERKDAGAAIQSRTRVWWQRFLQTHPVIHRQGTEGAP